MPNPSSEHNESRASEHAPDSDEQHAPSTEARGGAWSAWRIFKLACVTVVAFVAVGIGMLMLILGLLQTHWGTAHASSALLNLANPYTESHLSAERVRGDWIRSLNFYDISLYREHEATGDTVHLAQLDSLSVRYNVLALLRGTIHLREISARGLQAQAHQDEHGRWDLFEPFVPEEEDTTAAFAVRIDDVNVDRVQAAATFYPHEADSTFYLTHFGTQLNDLYLSEEASRFDLQHLDARFIPPREEIEREFNASMALSGRSLAVRRLDLESPYSNLTGSGTLYLPGEENEYVDHVDFQLAASPLDFRDLAGLSPDIDPTRHVNFNLTAEGTEELVDLSLNATFSDDGTVEATGSYTPVAAADGSREYVLDASIRNLDPYFFTADVDEPIARFSADLATELEGPSLEQISGPLHLELYEGSWDGYVLSPTELNANFTNGLAQIDFSGGLQGATFAVDGTMQPFEPEPIYDLRAQFSNINLQRFDPESETFTDLSGILHVDGHGMTVETANLAANLELSPSTINEFHLQSGHLQAQLREGSLEFDTRATSQQGRFSATGAAENLQDVPRYSIRDGRLNSVDVAALAGDTTRSEINAQFALTGQGTTAEDMVIEQARINVGDSFYGHYNIRTASLNAGLRGGLLNVNGNLDMAEAGTFDLAASARPFAASRPWTIRQASFANVDIGVLMQQPEHSSSLFGSLEAEGHGTTAETMQAEGTLALDSSRVNRQTINNAALDASLSSGFLEYSFHLDLPGGDTQFAGTAQPFAEPMPYTASGSVEALNLGALMAQPNLYTELYGDIELEGTGTDVEDMVLQATAELHQSQLNEETITDGRLSVRLEEGIGSVNTHFSFVDDGSLTALVEANLREPETTYEGALNMHRLRLGRLAGTDTLDARFSADAQFSGRGTDPETMVLTGQMVSSEARYASLHADGLDMDFILDTGLLQIENFQLRTNVARATGRGQVALFETAADQPSDFRLTGTIQSLEPLRPYVEAEQLSLGRGSFSARVYGLYDALRFDVRADGERLVYNDLRAGDFEASLVGQLDSERALELAEVEGTVEFLSLPQFATERIEGEATYQDDEIGFLVDILIDDQRDIQFAGAAELQEDRQRIVFDAFDMRLDDDEWELLQQASITYNDIYRVRNFLIFSDDQQIAIDGAIDLQGEQSLALTIENARIGSVADLLGYEGLDGRLNGTIDLTGPATAPNLLGALSMDLVSEGRRVGDLNLALDYSDLRLNIDALLAHEDGSQLTTEGYLPMDLRLAVDEDDVSGIAPELVDQAEMRLTIESEEFAIDWIRPFLDDQTVSRIDGRLTTHVEINGTPASPQLSGSALLTRGLFLSPDIGATYRDIQATLEFTEDRVDVVRATMTSGDGTMEASGTINMTALTLGEYDLEIVADNFLALNTSLYRARTDANLNVRGTTARPQIEGGLRIVSGDLYLGDEMTGVEVEEVELSQADLRILEQRFGMRLEEEDVQQANLYEAMAMDIEVRFERDTWLRSRRSPNMDVQFTGSLDLQKAHDEELQLFGSIDVVPERSRVSQFGRRFDITEGSVTFNGPVDDPMFEIHAEYEVPSRRHRESEAIITLAISGRMDDLDLTLGSSPAGLDGTDIASYLITGRPASAGFVGGGTQPGGLAGDIAFGQISSLLETAAGAELGLDVVEIEQDTYRGVTTITAGSYVSPRLFLAVSQPIALGSPFEQVAARDLGYTQITIEYELQRWLLLRLLSRNYLEVNLLWEYSY